MAVVMRLQASGMGIRARKVMGLKGFLGVDNGILFLLPGIVGLCNIQRFPTYHHTGSHTR